MAFRGPSTTRFGPDAASHIAFINYTSLLARRLGLFIAASTRFGVTTVRTLLRPQISVIRLKYGTDPGGHLPYPYTKLRLVRACRTEVAMCKHALNICRALVKRLTQLTRRKYVKISKVQNARL